VPRAAQEASAAVASEQQQLLTSGHIIPGSDQLNSHSTFSASPTQAHVVAAVTSHPQSESSSNWRCAEFVVANSKPVQQLHASKLATGTGRQLLNSGQPLLVVQLQLALGTLQQRSQHNAQTAGTAAVAAPEQQTTRSKSHLQLHVLCSPGDHNRFISADTSKNIPGSYYHVRKPETSTVQMTFTDWLDCWQSWTTNRLLLQVGAVTVRWCTYMARFCVP
jgi:hypothetical protein